MNGDRTFVQSGQTVCTAWHQTLGLRLKYHTQNYLKWQVTSIQWRPVNTTLISISSTSNISYCNNMCILVMVCDVVLPFESLLSCFMCCLSSCSNSGLSPYLLPRDQTSVMINQHDNHDQYTHINVDRDQYNNQWSRSHLHWSHHQQ